jgi:hypothetical protein
MKKGTGFLERKSLRMSRIEATLLQEAKSVMATKSRTRPRNSIEWEGQTTLEGFIGIPRRQRASRRNDMSRKQSFLFGARTRKSLQYTTQLTPWRAQYLWIKSEKEFQTNSDQVKPNGSLQLKVVIIADMEGKVASKQRGKQNIAEGMGHIDLAPPHKLSDSLE